jgi:hypothetical protein
LYLKITYVNLSNYTVNIPNTILSLNNPAIILSLSITGPDTILCNPHITYNSLKKGMYSLSPKESIDSNTIDLSQFCNFSQASAGLYGLELLYTACIIKNDNVESCVHPDLGGCDIFLYNPTIDKTESINFLIGDVNASIP